MLRTPISIYHTALSWTALGGYVGAVEVLLTAKDINRNVKVCQGRLPFATAAANGHIGIVDRLLQANVVNFAC